MIASNRDTTLPRLVMGGAGRAPRPRQEDDQPPPDGATVAPEDVAGRLIAGRLVLWNHPQAVRAAVRALHAEGVRFAGTTAGAEWLERLAGSDLARYGRFVWESYGMNAALGEEVGLLPSAWLDALVATSRDPRLEEILAAVVLHGVEDELVPSDGSPARDPRPD